jgi:membrane protease YdiL (CAAX protease family)
MSGGTATADSPEGPLGSAGATLGLVAAGIALALSVRPWQAETPRLVALVAAAVATLSFVLRRHGGLDRRRGAPIAGAGAVGIGAGGVAGIGAGADPLPAGAVCAGGVLAFAGAWADWRGVPAERFPRLLQRAVAAATVGIAGIVAIVVWGGVLQSLVPAESLSPLDEAVLSTLALGLGTGTVAAAYLSISERDVSYVDVALPDRREWGYVVVGTVLLLVSNVAISAAFGWLGVESTTHSIIRAARDAPEMLLVLVPLSYLVVGPGEELLYRNVVQKSLTEEFSPAGAIVVATAIFAAVHLPAYADPSGSALATLNTLAVVFVLSLILGTVYERTGNLVVSALVHGSFNAIAFLVTYAELTGVFG